MTSPAPSDGESAGNFNSKLHNTLLDLSRHPYPLVPNPPNLSKRASVALIIRINPSYSHWPDSTSFPTSEAASESPPSTETHTTQDSLTTFFTQPWVQHGTPEVLFIKRANRTGDRWTGHVALPGGRRDPEDADDLAAAVRETWEEVGIDLSSPTAPSIHVGNLPQRLVTSSWGSIPLMILCPYIFLLTSPPTSSNLKLQPTEVASAHWVPLQTLLDPRARTYEYQDVSARLAGQSSGVKRLAIRAGLGLMLFSAVRLTPTTSFTSSAPPPAPPQPSHLQRFTTYLGLPRPAAQPPTPDLLLWGLTLGVLADFLELLPPHNALKLWTYPTFSALDVRFVVWLLGYRFRREKYRLIQEAAGQRGVAGQELNHKGKSRRRSSVLEDVPRIELGLDAVPTRRGSLGQLEREWHNAHPPGAGESGVGVAREHERTAGELHRVGSSGELIEQRTGGEWKRVRRGSRSSRIGVMLEGYYEIIRRAIAITLLMRTVVGAGLGVWAYRRYYARDRRRGLVH